MHHILYILCFVLFSNIGISQSKKFKKWVDTTTITENKYILNHTIETFFSDPIIKQEIDLLNIDKELLDACVFFTINKARKKLHRRQLIYSQTLYKSASIYSEFYNQNYFKKEAKNNFKAIKNVKYAIRKWSYHCSQINVSISNCRLLDIKNSSRFYYDKKSVQNGESELGVFHGQNIDKYDSTIVKEEVKPYTYEGFANIISKTFVKRNARDIRNKAWQEGACSVVVDKRTLYRNKIPSAKLIFIYGAQRTALIPAEI